MFNRFELHLKRHTPPPLFLLISGPSGSGKTTLCYRILAEFKNFKRIVTATTRLPREGEMEGRDYHFLGEEAFLAHVKKNDFLEHASVYNAHYGVLKKEVLEKAQAGNDLAISLDVQGAKTLQENFKGLSLSHRLRSIFVTPPSLELLKKRLDSRGSDTPLTITKRLETAEEELKALSNFDYLLISRDRESDWLVLKSIYHAEKTALK